jgi:hypothetical protein
MLQYWFRHHGFFQCVKGLLLLVVPFPLDLFSRKARQWCCDPAVILDESSVKIGKSEKALDPLDVSRLLLFPNLTYLFFIHSQALWGDDISKIFHLCCMEFTF